MKTTSAFRPLFLLVSLAIQSCTPDLYPEGSLDYIKQHYAGPSYGNGKEPPSNEDFGLNMSVFYTLIMARAFSQMNVPQEHTFIMPPDSTSLLASTRRQLSFGKTYDSPEPTSFFKSEKFVLMPGLQLIQKGSKISDSFGSDITRLLYLEIPIYALYRHPLPDNKGEVFGGLGPYVAYGLTGTFKSTYNGQTTKSNAFDTNNGGYKRFDAGLAFTAGYQFPGSLRIRLAYELGLLNIQPNPFGSDGDKTFNRALSVNVGYPLQKIIEKFRK